MPFLAPLVPIIAGVGSAAAGGAGLISALKGDSSGKQVSRLASQQAKASEFGLGEAQQLLPQATGDLTQAQNFWQALLSGDRTKMMSFLQPEVNTILSQYDTARKNISEFGPRGSGRAGAITQSRFQEAGDISNLLATARPQAAQQLTDIGQMLGNLGLGAMGQGTGASSVSLSGLLQKRGQDVATHYNLGTGLGTLLAALLMRSQGGGGGDSGGSSDASTFSTLLSNLFDTSSASLAGGT